MTTKTVMKKVFDTTMIRSFYDTKPVFKAVLDLFSQRRRGRVDTTTRRLMRLMREAGHNFTYQDLVDMYRNMEKAGAGRLVPGRKAHLTRFLWDWNLVSIAYAVTGRKHPDSRIEDITVQKETRRPLPRVYHSYKYLTTREEESKAPDVPVVAPEPPVRLEPKGAERMVIRKGGFEIDVPASMDDECRASVLKLMTSL